MLISKTKSRDADNIEGIDFYTNQISHNESENEMEDKGMAGGEYSFRKEEDINFWWVIII